jgi:mannosyltransferase
MSDHNKTYGFTINIYDNAFTLPSLWPETLSFIADHPEYVAADNSMGWLTSTNGRPEKTAEGNGYSTCHFWSNFEIGDLDFWRGQAYDEYFTRLDRTGGFFYERWGDAPFHSVALGLFEENERIHW